VILCYLLYLFVGCNHSAHKFGSEVLCPEFWTLYTTFI
jgi:hypothetical protein